MKLVTVISLTCGIEGYTKYVVNMTQNLNKFDAKKTKNILIQESKFISSLFQVLALPKRFDKQDEETEVDHTTKKKPTLPGNKTSRALTLTELQSRFDRLKLNKPTHKERLMKKKEKLKKKLKRDLKAKKNKPSKADVTTTSDSIDEDKKQTNGKPVFNSEEKILFSKIDFSGLGQQRKKKRKANPSKLLDKVKEVDEKVEQLNVAGETDKANAVREKQAWKNALARSQGEKIKDDPLLLKKSIKKLEQRKQSRKKKWDARIQGVEKTKSERQEKRTENIDKRKKDKKLKKLKKAAKKGRIIPGF